jgi:sterol desaturase/sphingolipid hydroxylase (fatty acid hydroxylase superfamily)
MEASSATSRTERLRASPPMFENRWLDRLSRVHPATPLVIYLPVIAVLLTLAAGAMAAWAIVAAVVAGYLVWTLTEYWLHRVVFHFEPEHPLGARLHWIIHGVHHDHPNDPKRLVMPPGASVPLALLFTGLFVLVVGSPEWMPFEAGFLTGYLLYDMTHYYLHHHRPRSRWGKRLRELHMRHHFQDDTTGFGVSAPWWDHVFRTATTPRRRAS